MMDFALAQYLPMSEALWCLFPKSSRGGRRVSLGGVLYVALALMKDMLVWESFFECGFLPANYLIHIFVNARIFIQEKAV